MRIADINLHRTSTTISRVPRTRLTPELLKVGYLGSGTINGKSESLHAEFCFDQKTELVYSVVGHYNRKGKPLMLEIALNFPKGVTTAECYKALEDRVVAQREADQLDERLGL